MPTWGEVLGEIDRAQGDCDTVRRKYLAALHDKTGRAIIVYETAFLAPSAAPELTTLRLEDKLGFMEAVSNIPKDNRQLDLILHSPGGEAEAAEAIMQYLRTRFDHIRAVIPMCAMSAATMMALGSDEIVMGTHSQLGPIDPQFTVITPEGPRTSPGQAIQDQFNRAKEECRDPKNLAAWTPILRTYSPGLLSQVDHATELSKSLVAGWLRTYMFRDEPDAEQKGINVASWFTTFGEFGSHARAISGNQARAQGIVVKDLEDDDAFQDLVLSVHHATQITLDRTPVRKIVENHLGRVFLKLQAPRGEFIGPIPIQTPPGLRGTPSPIPGESQQQENPPKAQHNPRKPVQKKRR